jgi:hypothetical protein
MVTTLDAEDPSAVLDADVKAKQTQDRIHLLKQLRLGLSSTYYSMAQALGLRRLQDFFQVTASLASLGGPLTCPLPYSQRQNDVSHVDNACAGDNLTARGL